jgi:hypothetical protein
MKERTSKVEKERRKNFSSLLPSSDASIKGNRSVGEKILEE